MTLNVHHSSENVLLKNQIMGISFKVTDLEAGLAKDQERRLNTSVPHTSFYIWLCLDSISGIKNTSCPPLRRSFSIPDHFFSQQSQSDVSG